MGERSYDRAILGFAPRDGVEPFRPASFRDKVDATLEEPFSTVRGYTEYLSFLVSTIRINRREAE